MSSQINYNCIKWSKNNYWKKISKFEVINNFSTFSLYNFIYNLIIKKIKFFFKKLCKYFTF